MSTEMREGGDFVRLQIIKNPAITYDQLVAAWASERKSGVCPENTYFFNAKVSLKRKYKIEQLSELPRSKDGSPSVSGMMMLLFRDRGELSLEAMTEMLAKDGLEFSSSLYRSVKARAFPLGKAAPKEPAMAAHTAPRARLKKIKAQEPSEPAVEPKATAKVAEEILASIEFSKMEDELDVLLTRAKSLQESALVETLKQARRVVILRSQELIKS